MTEQTQKAPLFEESTVVLATKNGECKVPAMTHQYCPGIAVTMAGFGVFRVTHIASGSSMSGDYERAGSAALIMVQLAMIAKAGNSDWSKIQASDAVEFIESINDLPVPFSGATTTKDGVPCPMSIKDFMSCVRLGSGFMEFPWEESSPYDEAFSILEELTGEEVAQQPDSEREGE